MYSDLTVTDMFCGSGGSTTGAVQAGATVRLAINHWAKAIESHQTNYPQTTHVLTDLHVTDPRRFPSTNILIASPECTNHSLAKGRKRTSRRTLWNLDEPPLPYEAEERSRCTMWTPLEWAEVHLYQAVILENVVDVVRWAPFPAWLHAWKLLGYEYQLVSLNSMHAPFTPQSRDRLYMVFWRRGSHAPNLSITPDAHCSWCAKEIQAVQSWKNLSKRYGKYRQQYCYRCPLCAKEVFPYFTSAAHGIDWSLPSPRIGDRRKPLRPKTMDRIASGLERFCTTKHLIVQLSHSEQRDGRSIDASRASLPTLTTRDDLALVTTEHAPFLLDHLGEYRPREITRACSTICAGGNHHSLITPPSISSWLMTYYQHGQLIPVQEAAPTVTTLERHALVTGTQEKTPLVEECGFRMLAPHEIQAMMAFPPEYIVKGTRREKVKQLGNAVTPPVMKLLMERVIQALSA